MKKRLETIFRHYFPKRISNYKLYRTALAKGRGLEIGGPSHAFSKKGYLPVYAVAQSLDGCNFGAETVWEGKLEEGMNYRFDNRRGYQYISDGTNLKMIKDEHYDFILSCHSIEHFANPIKAIKEWSRVLHKDGHMILVVPHKDNTFDHKRPVTQLEHLLQDEQFDTQESDTTHFEEVIALHDIDRDLGIENMDALKKRTADNINNRCVHHHVFNTPLVVRLMDHLGFQILDVSHFNPFNIILLLKKTASGNRNNMAYLNPDNNAYQKPQFPSDKIW